MQVSRVGTSNYILQILWNVITFPAFYTCLSHNTPHLNTAIGFLTDIVMPRSLIRGFLWSRWRGKRSRHSRRMRDSQVYVFGKRRMQWRRENIEQMLTHKRNRTACIHCLLNRLFRRRSKKTSKLLVTSLCEGNPPVTSGSPHKGPVTRKMSLFDDTTML